MATQPVCQPDAQSDPKIEAAPAGFVEMERLRILGLGESDDRLARELVGTEQVLVADDEILVEFDHGAASVAARRRMKATFFCVMTVSPVLVDHLEQEVDDADRGPRARDARALRSCGARCSRSPGRTGFSHLTSSTPGAPWLAVRRMNSSQFMRIRMDAGVPARGDQAARHRALGGLGVEMERLRIEFAREFDDLFGA